MAQPPSDDDASSMRQQLALLQVQVTLLVQQNASQEEQLALIRQENALQQQQIASQQLQIDTLERQIAADDVESYVRTSFHYQTRFRRHRQSFPSDLVNFKEATVKPERFNELLNLEDPWELLSLLLEQRYTMIWLSPKVVLTMDQSFNSVPERFPVEADMLFGCSFSFSHDDHSRVIYVLVDSDPTMNDMEQDVEQGMKQVFQLVGTKPAQCVVRATLAFPTASHFNTNILQWFLDRNRKHQSITFDDMLFTTAGCQSLANFQRPFTIERCSFEDGGVFMLQELVSNNLGPTSLGISCAWNGAFFDFPIVDPFPTQSLRNALVATSSLETLDLSGSISLHDGSRISVDFDIGLLVEGIQHNHSLIRLDLHDVVRTEDEWSQVMNSVRHHRALLHFSLLAHLDTYRNRFNYEGEDDRLLLVTRMLDANKTIQSLCINTELVGPPAFLAQIAPRLKLNLLLPRFRSLMEEEDASVRNGLILRALVHPDVNEDPNTILELMLGMIDYLATISEAN